MISALLVRVLALAQPRRAAAVRCSAWRGGQVLTRRAAATARCPSPGGATARCLVTVAAACRRRASGHLRCLPAGFSYFWQRTIELPVHPRRRVLALGASPLAPVKVALDRRRRGPGRRSWPSPPRRAVAAQVCALAGGGTDRHPAPGHALVLLLHPVVPARVLVALCRCPDSPPLRAPGARNRPPTVEDRRPSRQEMLGVRR